MSLHTSELGVGFPLAQANSGSAESSLRVCGASNVGLCREENQDTFLIADLASGELSSPCLDVLLPLPGRGYLLLVCDGMGGAAAGEVAAQIAAESIKQRLVQVGPIVAAHPTQALGEAVAVANRAILDDVRGHPSRRGMGTTCTAAIVLPGVLTIAQVGDSRAYLWRSGQMSLLTRDQSLGEQLLDEGVLTPDEVSTFALRHVLSQALGTRGEIAPVISQHRLLPGDRILICSDGLHGLVSEETIQAGLGSSDRLSDAAQALVESALTAGGDDNVTVVVAEYRGGATD